MQKQQELAERAKEGFIPRFHQRFLHPRYWGVWFSTAIMILLAYIPAKVRNPALAALGQFIGRRVRGARRRARINLTYCFPAMTAAQREALMDKMFATILPTTILLVEQAIRRKNRIEKHVCWHGEEHLAAAVKAEHNIILLVPHGWGIDIPGILLAEKGHPIAAMFHHQRNELVDYLWNKARLRFGGRIHARQDGIKPFISSVRQGFWGYYLPDQDHGEEQSEFVDFFATYKATLPAVGRLMKVCRAEVIPLFPVYCHQDSTLHIYIRPPMSDLLGADDQQTARRMNEEVEALVTPNLEHYTWVLRLLKTRKQGDVDPYSRRDI